MKHVYYHVRNESPVYGIQDAWGWCTGMTQRDDMGREVGGGFRIGNSCTPVVDSCQCMAKPIQYCKVKFLKKIFLKSTNNKCWRGCVEKETLLHCWWECKLTQTLWKTEWRFLRKVGIKPPYDPLLGIYSEETKIEKDICIPLFTAALFTIARTWKQHKLS